MRPVRQRLIFLFLLIRLTAAYPQEEKIPDYIMEAAEELSEYDTDADAAGEFAVRLSELAEKPIRINTADENELSGLFFLTDFQIKSLADYIRKTGKIYTIYEIAAIPGFDASLARMIAPFVSLDDYKQINGKPSGFRNDLLSNFTLKYPEADTSAPGESWKILARYRFSAGKFSGHITSEKDAGEKLFPGKMPVTDFLSAGLVWEGAGLIRKVIAGDFGARYGLGTAINTGLRTGLSLTQTGYLTGGDEIRPYTSGDENLFFRGVAVQLRRGNTGMTMFCSRNRIDASTDTAENSQMVTIRTFQRSGLHTTASSLASKDAVAESSYGISFSTDIRALRLNLLWVQNRFSVPVMNNDPSPGELYDFSGRTSSTASAAYRYMPGRLLLYGEISLNLPDRKAWVQGISFRPSDRLSVNMVYRHYDPGFFSFHGKGLFSSSSGDNSEGLFGNFIFEAARHLFLSAGADVRSHPWLRYRCSAPSTTFGREIRLRYLPTENFSFEAVYSKRASVYDITESTGIKKQNETEASLLKLSFRYLASDHLTLTTRIDCKRVSPSGSEGIIMLQDVSWRISGIPATLWFRHCIIRTGDWDSRIYAYENDLVNSFSVPALWGNGSRTCIMLTVKAWKSTDLRIKFASGDSYGSEGNKNSGEMKIQVRVRF